MEFLQVVLRFYASETSFLSKLNKMFAMNSRWVFKLRNLISSFLDGSFVNLGKSEIFCVQQKRGSQQQMKSVKLDKQKHLSATKFINKLICCKCDLFIGNAAKNTNFVTILNDKNSSKQITA